MPFFDQMHKSIAGAAMQHDADELKRNNAALQNHFREGGSDWRTVACAASVVAPKKGPPPAPKRPTENAKFLKKMTTNNRSAMSSYQHTTNRRASTAVDMELPGMRAQGTFAKRPGEHDRFGAKMQTGALGTRVQAVSALQNASS